jgi:hypothetical protein
LLGVSVHNFCDEDALEDRERLPFE